uniref:Uncharacterized protein n=1 Tax=Octopus bimaculoides TaxID=37653 RepID=A0A0L8HTD9_OCTBM
MIKNPSFQLQGLMCGGCKLQQNDSLDPHNFCLAKGNPVSTNEGMQSTGGVCDFCQYQAIEKPK